MGGVLLIPLAYAANRWLSPMLSSWLSGLSGLSDSRHFSCKAGQVLVAPTAELMRDANEACAAKDSQGAKWQTVWRDEGRARATDRLSDLKRFSRLCAPMLSRARPLPVDGCDALSPAPVTWACPACLSSRKAMDYPAVEADRAYVICAPGNLISWKSPRGTFQTDVLDRSHSLPVVVDFWAEWCASCRQLGPVLEREAAQRPGRLELVKLDVDANPTVRPPKNWSIP
jgi:hypothetical protein